MTRSRLTLLLLFGLLIGAFFVFDLGEFLSLDYLKSQQQGLSEQFHNRPWLTAGIYFVLYVAVTGLSLPGAAILTLAGGAVFGLLWGLVIVSFASTIGATLAFLASRFLFRDSIQTKFGAKLETINRGMARDGAFYLFALRLVPLFPFFMINLLMGLTKLRTVTFFWVSQLGMLAGTVVYVNAGTELAKVENPGDILSPSLIGAFVLLAAFPLIGKTILESIKSRRVYKRWQAQRPKKFDFNLLAIGAGAGGLVSVYIGAAVKAKVALVEKHRMGGDCLNTGCVPSKAILRSAKFLEQSRRSKSLGLENVQVDFRFKDVMDRVHRIIKTIEPHDSIERYTELGVDCYQGTAKITSPWSVEINGPEGKQTLTTRSIVIATGGRPFVPDIPGLDEIEYLTSDTVWDIEELPARLLVIGGGPIGCELAQAFSRLGSEVTLVQRRDRLMPKEDPEIADLVAQRFRDEGIHLQLGSKPVRFERDDDRQQLIVSEGGQETPLVFDKVLFAVGRAANTSGFGLEELGIPVTDQGTVEVNEYMQTVYPNIYACGDVAGPYQFTHTAAHTAWYAAVNALFGRFKKFRADFSVIPWATFTEPEVARVGLNEQDAKAQSIPYEITTYGIDDLDRAIADEEAHGVVKVLTEPGKDRILGVTIAGEHAGDLIAEYVLAMRHGIGLNKILGTIHIYPTLAEANKYAAGNWKKAHSPAGLLTWVERFHSWMRG